MNSSSDRLGATNTDRRLSEMLIATVRYLPVLAGLLTLGLLGIYFLSLSGVLGAASWQVLPLAGASLLVGLATLAVALFARRGRSQLAFLLFWFLMAAWSMSAVLLLEAALPVAILMVWLPPLVGVAARQSRRTLLVSAIMGATLTAALYWLDRNPWMDRLPSTNPAGTAAVILMASAILLFALGSLVVRLFQYRTLQGRLVVSFTLILAVPVLLITAISAINANSSSQAQLAGSLQAISTLKESQIESAVRSISQEMTILQQGSGTAASLLQIIEGASETSLSYRYRLTAGTLMRDVMARYPTSQYEEMLLLDTEGNVLFSTFEPDQGLNLSNKPFAREGRHSFFAEMVKFPGKQNPTGEYKLVAAAPLFGANGTDVRGVVVAVAKSNLIIDSLGATAGLPDIRSYLVGENGAYISNAATAPSAITAWPLVHRTISKQGSGSDIYTNERDVSVLGYSSWDPTINAEVVTEVPRSIIFSNATSTLLVSGLVGLFAIIMAAVAAVSTSQAVSEPVLRLASSAKAFAGGDLTSRSSVEQRDEVGRLGESFNLMADQLQGIIGNLEQRVAERTEALEQQGVRLRTAAEVARDAASAPSLDDLLDQAARLILNRFGFYHTGIFLVDEKHEYAVLRASPSEAGKAMLANQHKLRIGEQGIVGRVAATGEPRIALDTGVDPMYFNNPMLPNTRSEMALPLKTAQGTFGVIDIQSDQPEAFTQDDIAIVQIMADQLATAIQRTQLLQQVQVQLQQLEQNQQQFTQQSWQVLRASNRSHVGYRFDNVRLEAVQESDSNVDPFGSSPAASTLDTTGAFLEIPVRLRGQTIGAVKLRFQSGQVPAVTAAVAQQIADRLGTALENARLLEDSVRKANKERAIGEITSRISSSVNMRNVLQTAVEELGRAIPGSDVLIQLRPDKEFQR